MKSAALKPLLACLALLTLGAAAHAEPVSLASVEQFDGWDDQTRQAYVRELREAYALFESSLEQGLEFVLAPTAKPAEFGLFRALLPVADADAPGYCMVGGKLFTTVEYGDRVACPTKGNGCSPAKDEGFRCGVIYNAVCVDRQPTGSLSARCRQAGDAQAFDSEKYAQMRSAVQGVVNRCRSADLDPKYKPKCEEYVSRVRQLDKKYKVTGYKVSAAAAAADDAAMPEDGAEYLPPPVDGGSKPGKKKSPPKVEKHDGGARDRGPLGALGCVAQALEEKYPSGGGMTNWVALLGVMAQRHHGKFDVRTSSGRADFQQEVAEMVASYGYCSNRDYPIDLPPETAAWIDGRPLDKKKFAKAFGLTANRTDFISRFLQNNLTPMTYADALFDDGGWDGGSPQSRQWRFRAMSTRHAKSYPGTPFGRCAAAANGNMERMSAFKMCPPKKKQPAMDGNNSLFGEIAGTCGFPAKRRVVRRDCDRRCIPDGPYKNAEVFAGCEKHQGEGGTRGGRTGTPGSRGTPGTKGGEGPGNSRGSSDGSTGSTGTKGGEGPGTNHGGSSDGSTGSTGSTGAKGGGEGPGTSHGGNSTQ